jgi:uncharacterized protein YndB with AHSA1/START domain
MEVTEVAVVPAPVDAVFAAAADPHRQLEWDAKTLRRVEQLTPGALAAGARFRGSFKGFGTVEYEFAEYEPPRRFAHLARIRAGRMTHQFTFEPVDGVTRLTQVGALEPNALGRVMAPVMRSLFARRFRLIASELDEFMSETYAEPAASMVDSASR